MDKQKFLDNQWRRRKQRVRKKILGDQDRPRLSVFRSARHMYAQVIDDSQGITLAAASTAGKEVETAGGGNCAAATLVGEAVAKKALSLGIRQVRFDRNGFRFHGRVKALAEGARKAGLVF